MSFKDLYPLEVFLPGAELEVILDDAEVHLRVAYHGEDRLGRDLGKLAEIFETDILEEEFLLIDGCGREECSVDTLAEPLRGEVAGVANLPDILDLVTGALRLPIAQGDVAADLLTVLQFVRARNLGVAHTGPTGVQS